MDGSVFADQRTNKAVQEAGKTPLTMEKPVADTQVRADHAQSPSITEWSFDSEYEKLGFAALSSCGCACP